MKPLDVFNSRPAAVIAVSGEDHFEFLQSQGAADLRGPVGLCRYGLWLDHKGLIHGDAFILRISDQQVLLISYETPAKELIEKFERHIIADDVELSDVTSRWRLLSITADCAHEMLANRAKPLDPHTFMTEADGYLFPGRRLGPGSVDYLVPETSKLTLAMNNLTAETMESMRIKAAVPSVPRDIPAGRLNPIEAGLTDAVSFDKGCYLGQEVVARVHRLQRASRRLVQVTCAADESGLPEIPFDLLASGTVVGALSSVVKYSDGWKGIGCLKAKVQDGEQELNGRTLLIKSIPFM